MLRNRLEYHIKNHTTEEALIDALDVYRCYNVPDKGEYVQGQEKLVHYWEIKRGMYIWAKQFSIWRYRYKEQ